MFDVDVIVAQSRRKVSGSSPSLFLMCTCGGAWLQCYRTRVPGFEPGQQPFFFFLGGGGGGFYVTFGYGVYTNPDRGWSQ